MTARYRVLEARHPVRRAAAVAAWRALRWAAAAAVAAAVAPVTVIAAGAAGYAWWRGCPPGRLYRAALCCLPVTAAWLITVVAWPARGTGPPGTGAGALWFRAAAAPYRALAGTWLLAAHGRPGVAVLAVAPVAVPAGLAAGGLGWAYRNFRMRSGAGGLTPAAPAAFDERQWRHQVRTARSLTAAAGALPLLARDGGVLAGATIRSVRHAGRRTVVIPYQRLRAHQVVIGSTGTGKTTLLLRLWAGFMAAGLRRHAAGAGRRPLLVVLDCKGGAASRKVAGRTRRVLREAGAWHTAIWPAEASLSLWTLPPDRLVTTLLDLIEHGTGSAAYYTDVMEALVALAVCAPCGPPASAADFLGRLDPDWLAAAYGASGDGQAVSTARSAARALHDVRLRFAALWRRLGAGLDGGAAHGGAAHGGTAHGGTAHGGTAHGGGIYGGGTYGGTASRGTPGGERYGGETFGGGTFGGADAWYCVLEGTAEGAVAQAQARALIDLLACYALTGEREILLAVDEFSAVSRRLPIWQLYERARSLGLAVQVSAQSWEGLAETEDERQRLADTAEGGIWLLRTPRPEPVAELAGTLPRVDTSRRLSGQGPWAGDGLSRTRLAPVLDADLVRRLDVGQVAYVYRGGVTFLQVKRITGEPAWSGRGHSAATLAAALALPRRRGPSTPGGRHATGGRRAADGRRAAGGRRAADGRRALGGRRAADGRHAAGGGHAAGGEPGTALLPAADDPGPGPWPGAARAPWPGTAGQGTAGQGTAGQGTARAPWPDAAWPVPGAPGIPQMTPPDADVVLDEAFGERRA